MTAHDTEAGLTAAFPAGMRIGFIADKRPAIAAYHGLVRALVQYAIDVEVIAPSVAEPYSDVILRNPIEAMRLVREGIRRAVRTLADVTHRLQHFLFGQFTDRHDERNHVVNQRIDILAGVDWV